jgi:hypothetical protein
MVVCFVVLIDSIATSYELCSEKRRRAGGCWLGVGGLFGIGLYSRNWYKAYANSLEIFERFLWPGLIWSRVVP